MSGEQSGGCCAPPGGKASSCCGGGAPIEVTARRDGVDVDGLVRALNAAVEGPQAGSEIKK